jgi:hypothetical protein
MSALRQGRLTACTTHPVAASAAQIVSSEEAVSPSDVVIDAVPGHIGPEHVFLLLAALFGAFGSPRVGLAVVN